jgi:predicted phosphodiesterase
MPMIYFNWGITHVQTRFFLYFLLLFSLFGSLPADAGEPIHIVVMGDNRQMNHYAEQPVVLRKAMNAIAAENPDYVFHTGDFIRGYTSDPKLVEAWYAEWFDIIKPVKDKMYIAPGNHDIWSKASMDIYQQKIGDSYLVKEIGPAVFIVVNSWFPDQMNKVTGAQFDWLQQQLEKYKNKKFKFVFSHSPAYSSGSHEEECLDKYPAERDRFVQLLQKYNVDVLFAGHEHVYHDRMMGNVRQIITGGGGADLYEIKGQKQFHHYLHLTVTDNSYEVETVMVEDPIPDIEKSLRKSKSASRMILELELVRQQFPGANDLLLYLGLAYEKIGNGPAAEQYFNDYLAARGHSPFAYGYLMDMLDNIDMQEKALRILEAGYQNNPSSQTLAAMVAREMIVAGRTVEGEKILQDIIAQNPADADMLYLIGNAYELMAGEYYKKIIKNDDDNPYRKRASKRLKYIRRLDD